MKTRQFHSRLAAAALFAAALGATVASTPAMADHPRSGAAFGGTAFVAQPRIERFVVRAPNRFESGREVRFRLVGDAGGRAWVDLPGHRPLALEETRPGVYEAEYVLRWNDNPDQFARAVAVLQRQGQRVTASADVRGEWDRDRAERHGRDGRDTRAPVISDVSPAQGELVSERGRTEIQARVGDAEQFTLRMNGQDVTVLARLYEGVVYYRDDLPVGRHTADLVVRDAAGNTSRKTWTFDVVNRYSMYHRTR